MRATTDFAADREGGSRCRRQPNHPSLDPDSANRPCFSWAAADGLLPLRSPPEAGLSFAFEEYSLRCYRTSCSTSGTRSWSDAVCDSLAMRTTVTFTCAVGEPENE